MAVIDDETKRRAIEVIREQQAKYAGENETERCLICDWTMAKSAKDGCVPGDCSYRTDDPAERRRLTARRNQVRRFQAPVTWQLIQARDQLAAAHELRRAAVALLDYAGPRNDGDQCGFCEEDKHRHGRARFDAVRKALAAFPAEEKTDA